MNGLMHAFVAVPMPPHCPHCPTLPVAVGDAAVVVTGLVDVVIVVRVAEGSVEPGPPLSAFIFAAWSYTAA